MKKITIGHSIDERNNENENNRKAESQVQTSTRLSTGNVATLCAELARLNTNTIQYLACAELLIHKRIDEVIAVLKLSAANASSNKHGESLENLIHQISQLMNSAYETKEKFSRSAEQQAILTSDALNILIENLKRNASSY